MMKIQTLLLALLGAPVTTETITCDFSDTTVRFTVDPAQHDIDVIGRDDPMPTIEATIDGETFSANPIVFDNVRGFFVRLRGLISAVMVIMEGDQTATLQRSSSEHLVGTCKVL